jgi:hypothetical protein
MGGFAFPDRIQPSRWGVMKEFYLMILLHNHPIWEQESIDNMEIFDPRMVKATTDHAVARRDAFIICLVRYSNGVEIRLQTKWNRHHLGIRNCHVVIFNPARVDSSDPGRRGSN